MVSVSRHYGFDLETPFQELPPEAVEVLLYGTKGERFPLVLPDAATKGDRYVGKLFRFDGVINDIERRYRHYRRQKVANTWMDEYLKKVMVEHTCPDCRGTKLKRQRLRVTLNGRNIHELGTLPLDELRPFIAALPPATRHRQAGEQIAGEILARLDLLLGIGLDYLHLNRRATTLSGGESQRIRLSTQIGSGLMGILSILDEPTTGMHLADIQRLLDSLNRLVDAGNTVLVIEHHLDVIKTADYLIDLGPEGGNKGGEVLAAGTPEEVARNPRSHTGRFLRKVLEGGRGPRAAPEQRPAPQAAEAALQVSAAAA